MTKIVYRNPHRVSGTYEATIDQWATKNPTLDVGEPGYGYSPVAPYDYSLKFGDGETPWNSLPNIWMRGDLRTDSAKVSKGVVAVGAAYDGIAVNAVGTALTDPMNIPLQSGTYQRITYSVRAITTGVVQFAPVGYPSGNIGFGSSQWLAGDRNYNGGTFSWIVFMQPSITAVRIVTTGNIYQAGDVTYTPGIAVYGREFYMEDLGTVIK